MSPKKLKQIAKLSNILITTFCLASCGQTTHHVPVRDTVQPPTQEITHHTVARGETLYSIAWRYNLDYKKFALANGISSSFRIYPGQRLILKETVTPRKAAVSRAKKVVKESAKTPRTQRPRSIKETPNSKTAAIDKTLTKPKTWVWPARGKLIAGFDSNNGLNKGIDLRGNLEESVIAAAAGKVVYSGDGLRGYGKLVIIKHSEEYLSAYAHNHKLLVTEGVYVTRGQKIATMGSSGTDSVKLHFEIRYDGKPVNPLKYLPKR